MIQTDVQLFETHKTYTFNGYRYCCTRRGKPKRVYPSKDTALDAADEQMDRENKMLWPYRHHDHWHLTGLAPQLLPFIPPARWYSDGSRVKRKREKLGLPPKFRPYHLRYNGPHFLRVNGD